MDSQIMCDVSEEEEDGASGPVEESCHFARLSMLVFDVGQDSMRQVLQHTSKHDAKNLALRIKKKFESHSLKLLDHEKALLLPNIEYKKLDFSVMYKIARNTLNFEIRNIDKSKAEWGKDPDDNDESLLAAIERIRSVRNSAIGHAASTFLPKADFELLWKKMMKALEIIDKKFNLNNKAKGTKLETQPIDSSCVKRLQKMVKKEKKITEILEVSGHYDEEIKDHLSKLTETVVKKDEHIKILKGIHKPCKWEDFVRLNQSPEVIQRKTNNFFKSHLKEDEFVVETKSLKDAKEILQAFNHVTIKGVPGTGKTKLAVRLILNFVRSEPLKFCVIKLETPDDLQTLTPDVNQIIFVDDVFGKGLAEFREVRNWANTFKFFTESECNKEETDSPSGTLFIVTSRIHPFDSAHKISRSHPFLQKGVVVDLSPTESPEKKSPICTLETAERKEIVIQQFKSLKKKVPENVLDNLHSITESFTAGPLGFPLCAKLFASEDKFTCLGPEFFSKPHHHLLDLIYKAVEDADVNRVVFLTILFHENERKQSTEATEKKALCFQNEKYCQELMARNKLQHLFISDNDPFDIMDCESAAENLENLICRSGKGFCFSHESVHEAVELFFMHSFFHQAVESMDIKVLAERVHTEGSLPYIKLKAEDYPLFAQRLITEVENENAHLVCKSPTLNHPEFLIKFSEKLRELSVDDNCRTVLENVILSADKEEPGYNQQNLLSFALNQKAMDLVVCLLELMKEFRQEKSVTEMEKEKIVKDRLSCALIDACAASYSSMSVFHRIFTMFTESLDVDCNYCEFCHGRNLQIDTTPFKNGWQSRRSKHNCCLESASMVGNDEAVQTLLKRKAFIPHSSWNGWNFLHTCAECNDEQLCNHNFINALQKYHTSVKGSHEDVVIVKSKDSELCEIADLIHRKFQQPFNSDCLLELLIEILTELELTPEILHVFETYKIFIGERNHKYTVYDLEGVDNCSSRHKIPHTHSRPFNRENSSESASEIAVVKESGDNVYVYCLIHAVAKAKLSEKFLLRRDLSSTEVQSFQDVQSQSLHEESSLKDDTLTWPPTGDFRRRRIEGYEEYLESRERMIKLKELRNLMKHGCHIDNENVNGETVLTLEVMKEEIDLVFMKEILELEANPNIKDKGGCVPLHYVVSSRLEDAKAQKAVEMLVSKRADITIRNNKGNTPLSLAIDFTARQTKPRILVLQELLKSSDFNERYISMVNLDSREIIALHHVLECPFDENGKIKVLSVLKESLFESRKEKDKNGRTGLMKCIICDPHMVQLFEFLLLWPLDVTATDDSDCTVLHYIVQANCGIENKMDLLEKLGDDVKRIVNVKNSAGLSAIMIALRQNTIYLQLVEHLLKLGADLSLQDEDGLDCFAQTLQYSLRPGKLFHEKVFHEVNPPPNEHESVTHPYDNETVQWPEILTPSISREKKLLDMMEKHVKDFRQLDNKRRSYLHHLMGACLIDEDAVQCCQTLIQKNLDVDQEDDFGKSPIILAFELCPRMVELLKCVISASKKARSWPQRRVYEMIVRPGFLSTSLVEYLVKENILIGDQSSDSNSVPNLFHYLAEIGFVSFKFQKNKSLTGNLGFNFLKSEENNDVMLCLKNYFEINKKDRNSKTPLLLACKDAPIACIGNFVENGANILSRTVEEKIPAQIIIESDRSDSDVCRILDKHLLKDGCVNHKDESEKTPLALAVSCKKDRSETIKLLLERGADVTLRDNCDATVLHLSVGNEDKSDLDCQHYLQMLLQRNSDAQLVNTKNTSGMTPLNIAASIRNQSRLLCMLRLLELKECNVDTPNDLKRTPLLNCIINMRTLGFRPVVDLERLARVCILLAFGAKNTKDSNQMSVSNFCKENPHHGDIRNLILGSISADKSLMVSLLQKSITNVRSKYRPTGHKVPELGLSRLGRPLLESLQNAVMFLCDDELPLTDDYHEYDESTTSDELL